MATATARERILIAARQGVELAQEGDQVAFDTSFDIMIERAETVTVRGAAVRVVSKADLIEAKERAARDPKRRQSKALRDQADLELLRGDVGGPDEGW